MDTLIQKVKLSYEWSSTCDGHVGRFTSCWEDNLVIVKVAVRNVETPPRITDGEKNNDDVIHYNGEGGSFLVCSRVIFIFFAPLSDHDMSSQSVSKKQLEDDDVAIKEMFLPNAFEEAKSTMENNRKETLSQKVNGEKILDDDLENQVISDSKDRFEFAELDLEEEATSNRAKEVEVEGMSPREMLEALNTNPTDLSSIETRAKATQRFAKMGLLLGVNSGLPWFSLEEALDRMNIGTETKLRSFNSKSAGRTEEV